MKGIIFDLDGTLIDSTGIWKDIDMEFLSKRGKMPTAEYNRFVSNNPLSACAVFTKKYYSLDDSEEEIIAEWLHMSDDKYRFEIKLKPFVREYLTQCAAEGIPMSIATSCTPEHCYSVIRLNKIESYFDFISFVEYVGKPKDYPDVYLHTAAGMKISPEDCTVFEDSPNTVDGVKGAGFKLIGVYDEHTHWGDLSNKCDKFIYSFEELLKKKSVF